MITAVDTNVLIDIFFRDPLFGASSSRLLERCLEEGSLIACASVWSELAARFPEPEQLRELIGSLPVRFDADDERVALAAGTAAFRYRRSGGSRERILADFLIGSHASLRADRLLTRDRGFFRRYFEGLTVLDPAIATR